MDRMNWSSIVRGIDASRSGRARFFKPVCVIAAIDLADEGNLDPENLNADAVLNRFSDYVTPFFPDRGNDGFQPFWHLSNNQLWTFFKDGEALTSKDFSHGKPGTRAKLRSRFDRVAINADVQKLWLSKADRRVLRGAMLLMLQKSDGDSRRLVAPLFDPRHLLDEKRWPAKGVLEAYFDKLTDQALLWPVNPLEGAPAPIENVPSAFDYLWSGGQMAAGPNQADQPVFPFAGSECDHTLRLEACKVQAGDLIADLKSRAWQVRPDYAVEVGRYLERLPDGIGAGNILLADAAARILRDMFGAESAILPPPFAARLRALLQGHASLRPFYPELGDFYRAVKTGRLDRPLPIDAVNEVKEVVRGQTPTVFAPNVSNAIVEVSTPDPDVRTVEDAPTPEGDPIVPPPDPVGEVDPKSAHAFQVAGMLNRFWKVFIAADKFHSSTSAWMDTFHSLNDPMNAILDWLRHFLDR